MQIRIVDGNQLKELGDIENYMVDHFKNHYNETNPRLVQELMRDLENLEVPKLDSFQRNDLDRPVTDDEIEWVVFQLGPQKSSGPDGIPTFFYQEL